MGTRGHRVLVIAATDSSGGAGLTRDLATLTDFATEARCALTAVTVQTDRELRGIFHLSPELVRDQILAALEADDIGAVKIGMLGCAATVQAVLDSLPSRERLPIVLDPVLASSSGGTLLDQAGRQLLRAELLPRVSLLTPNVPEAATLLEESPASDPQALSEQALRLLELGPSAVLLKGGHTHGAQVTDILVTAGEPPVHLSMPRVRAERRGTGCSFASAVAAQLAAGGELADACRRAQQYVVRMLQRSP